MGYHSHGLREGKWELPYQLSYKKWCKEPHPEQHQTLVLSAMCLSATDVIAQLCCTGVLTDLLSQLSPGTTKTTLWQPCQQLLWCGRSVLIHI